MTFLWLVNAAMWMAQAGLWYWYAHSWVMTAAAVVGVVFSLFVVRDNRRRAGY